jgi:hypothetical protein
VLEFSQIMAAPTRLPAGNLGADVIRWNHRWRANRRTAAVVPNEEGYQALTAASGLIVDLRDPRARELIQISRRSCY